MLVASPSATAHCPLCRAAFSAVPAVNHELRELVALAAACAPPPGGGPATPTAWEDAADGWEAVGGVPGHGSAGAGPPPAPRAAALLAAATQPPPRVTVALVRAGAANPLHLDPPLTWVPDSAAPGCQACGARFGAAPSAAGWAAAALSLATAARRTHCRACGGLFCTRCCAARTLLPPRYAASTPARVCAPCAEVLAPLQARLAATTAPASRPPVHDVTENTPRAWLRPPVGGGMDGALFRATASARALAAVLAAGGGAAPTTRAAAAFCGPSPGELESAAGLALLTVAKVGLGAWAGALGGGVFVARRRRGGAGGEGDWGPPLALHAAGAGWGLQAGAALLDLLIVAPSPAAAAALAGPHVAAGFSAGGTAGKAGARAEAGVRLGGRTSTGGAARSPVAGLGLCRAYALPSSRGAFVGVSVDGWVVAPAGRANADFFGAQPAVRDILGGGGLPPPPAPPAAAALVAALDAVLAADAGRPGVEAGAPATPPAEGGGPLAPRPPPPLPLPPPADKEGEEPPPPPPPPSRVSTRRARRRQAQQQQAQAPAPSAPPAVEEEGLAGLFGEGW